MKFMRIKMTEFIFVLTGTLGLIGMMVSFFALGSTAVKPPSEIKLRRRVGYPHLMTSGNKPLDSASANLDPEGRDPDGVFY